jgi:Domain of unknown function (DUF4055)
VQLSQVVVVLTDRLPSVGCGVSKSASSDEFVRPEVEQIRVLKLVDQAGPATDEAQRVDGGQLLRCVVEIWQPKEQKRKSAKVEWELIETRTPLRLGKPLPLIPFVFHGPRHSRPQVDKLPLADIIAVNLDHYRLDADYKHGVHFTALPTAWVSGFDKSSTLRIGSSTAWFSETPGQRLDIWSSAGRG